MPCSIRASGLSRWARLTSASAFARSALVGFGVSSASLAIRSCAEKLPAATVSQAAPARARTISDDPGGHGRQYRGTSTS